MPTRELEVAVRTKDGIAIMDLTGELDSSAEAALEAGYADAAGTGARSIVLNFAGTDYINSTGIALIVGLLAQARSRGVEMKAYGLSDHYREIFEITRLADFMTIVDSENSAVSGAEGEDHA
jgi:anti-anti-sigma factor